MKKQNKIMIGVIGVLVLAAAILTFLNRRGANERAEGLAVLYNGTETQISFGAMQTETFEGDLVNGKGETSHHTYEGLPLMEVLEEASAAVDDETVITVTSEDNYSAEVAGAEILEAGKVYVALTQDGEMLEGIDGGQGAQLIVFGDPNSKRAVRYLKTIAVE